MNTKQTGFVIPLQFQPALHTEALKRRTQILFVPDISLILNKVSLKPNSTIREAGIGSGSLSHAFMQNVYPNGKLFNYDIVQDRVEQA